MQAAQRDKCLHQVFSPQALPLLAESLEALVELLRAQGAPPERFWHLPRGTSWLKTAHSLKHLLDSGAMDGAVLDRALAEIGDATLSADAVLDRFLLPQLLLAAARPTLAGDPPGWLVDALAAMIAVDAEAALLDLATAEERLDGDSGCLTQPWLARQTLPARWLARQLTPARLWRVLGGKDPWHAVIDAPLLADALAIHQGQSAQLSGVTYEEDDVFSLMDAFHALTCARRRVREVPTAVPLVPVGGGLRWQLAAGQLTVAGTPLTVGQATTAGFLEPPLPALPVPRPLGAGLLAAGWHTLRLELDDADAADELLDALLDLALDPLPPQALDGPGFRIVPHENP